MRRIIIAEIEFFRVLVQDCEHDWKDGFLKTKKNLIDIRIFEMIFDEKKIYTKKFLGNFGKFQND